MALIHEQIIKIMKDIPAVGKDRKNAQQGYNFRGIDDMYNALHEVMGRHGVFATSKVLEHRREERTSAKGGLLLYSVLDVEFTFYATDGSSVSSVMVGEAMDSADKATNKAMSAAMKYALMQLFCIPTAEKKDSEYDHHEVAPKPDPDAETFAAAVRVQMMRSPMVFTSAEIEKAVTRAYQIAPSGREAYMFKLKDAQEARIEAQFDAPDTNG